MKAIGLIVEYNPFHNGHKLHLEKSMIKTSGDISIAVMSGNFLQRGEPAVIDKWKRTEMAISNGVDMVVELPTFYSNQSAEIFAEGAIMILKHLKVDTIVFGSELGDVEELEKIAKLQQSIEFEEKIKNEMKQGISYSNASSKVLKLMIGSEDVLSPNNILGLEYIKANLKKGYNIKFDTIKREKTGFYTNDIIDNITSATNIREFILKGDLESIKKVVPEESYKILEEAIKKEEIVSLENFFDIIKYKILSNRDDISDFQDVEKGFENRMYESCLKNNNFEEFYDHLISKRYTNARIKRVLTHTLLGMKKEFVEKARQEVPYIRVLGFNKKGKEYMSMIKKNMEIPLITTLKNISINLTEEQREIVNYEIITDEIYKIKNYYDNPKKPVVKNL